MLLLFHLMLYASYGIPGPGAQADLQNPLCTQMTRERSLQFQSGYRLSLNAKQEEAAVLVGESTSSC